MRWVLGDGTGDGGSLCRRDAVCGRVGARAATGVTGDFVGHSGQQESRAKRKAEQLSW